MKIGLVLEGGAMRGVFTAGALDYFLDQGIQFPYVIAVSAGACQGLSYISGQRGRNIEVIKKFIHDKRYLSLRNIMTEGGFFGFQFMFCEIAGKYVPFDFEAFEDSNQEFVVVATDQKSGKPVYFYKSMLHMRKMFQACIASSSMPMAAKPVEILGRRYMDGGVSDSIPIEQAFLDGCDKIVVVLTRGRYYRKKPSTFGQTIARLCYRKDQSFEKVMENRYLNYNAALEKLSQLEKEKRAIIIRPFDEVRVRRTDRNLEKLMEFYHDGYQSAAMRFPQIKEWFTSEI